MKQNKYYITSVNDCPEIVEIFKEKLHRIGIPFALEEYDNIHDAISNAIKTDLLVIDLSAISPVCNGFGDYYRWLARWIEKHPNIPIFVMTGLGPEIVDEIIPELENVGVVSPIIKHLRLHADKNDEVITILSDLLQSVGFIHD